MPDMLVRLKKGKKTFEILTNDGAVTKYREKKLKFDQVIASGDDVFLDVGKAKKASRDELMAAFETDDVRAIQEIIVTKGEVQLSAAERKDNLDAKRTEIIACIHKNYVDSAKGTPVPLTRISNALEQIKPRIDPEQPADRQVTLMFDKLLAVLPLRKGNASISGLITVPTKYAGGASGVVRKSASVTKEDYRAEGPSWTVEVHDYDSLVRDLTRLTKGEYEFTVMGADGSAPVAPTSETSGKGKKGKKGKGRG
jgi:rRNA metabolism SBDS family protein